MITTTTGRKSGLPRRPAIEFHEFKGRKDVFSGWETKTEMVIKSMGFDLSLEKFLAQIDRLTFFTSEPTDRLTGVHRMDDQPAIESESKSKLRSRSSKKQEIPSLGLNIPEKLFILSIDDERGEIKSSIKSTLPYGLAGGLLAELALLNKVQSKAARLIVVDSTPTGDAWLDGILTEIASAQKPRKLSRWIEILGRKQTIKQTAARLADRNVIGIEKKRYLWIIPYDTYPQVDASAKYWVKQRLRGIVLAGEKTDESDLILISLLKACGLLRLLFTRDERKYASKKVDALVKGEVFGEAVSRLLEQAQVVVSLAMMH